MLQPEIPDRRTSLIAPADNVSPILLGTLFFIFFTSSAQMGHCPHLFALVSGFRNVDYLLESSHQLSVGITHDSREIFPTHYAKDETNSWFSSGHAI
jgi:hypothetical protein